MTAPSIDAVSGLVEDLRALSAYPGDPYDRAADALEAQARELAEARSSLSASRKLVELREKERDKEKERADDNWDAYREMIVQRDQQNATAQTRIAALEDAVRPLARAADALATWIPDDERHWPGEVKMPTVGEIRRARTALSNGEHHDR